MMMANQANVLLRVHAGLNILMHRFNSFHKITVPSRSEVAIPSAQHGHRENVLPPLLQRQYWT
jgi:hypothetical protein